MTMEQTSISKPDQTLLQDEGRMMTDVMVDVTEDMIEIEVLGVEVGAMMTGAGEEIEEVEEEGETHIEEIGGETRNEAKSHRE